MNYTCDKCKKEVDTENELFKVDITYRPAASYQIKEARSYEIKDAQKDYCFDCAAKIGLCKKVIKEGAAVAKPTEAEQLYDILCDMVSDAVLETGQ